MVEKVFNTLKWETVLPIFLIFLLPALSFYSFILFHSIAEIFSIVVAGGMFMVAWNSRQFMKNNYLLVLGIAYLFIGIIDLVHMLSYKGIGLFSDFGANLPTQLWIAARYMESFSLLIAPFFYNKKLNGFYIFSIYTLVTALVFCSIFVFQIFPDCFIEGSGLTLFKKGSEYIISIVLTCSIFAVYSIKKEFDEHVLKLVITSIVITVLAEISFTFYISVYGVSNLAGHLLKVLSFFLIYRALVETGFKRPYDLLFRNLKKSEQQLIEHQGLLEKIVKERTHELTIANQNLKQDLIKRKKLEAQLRQAYKMESIGTLASGIAHDFNNILASVIGFTEMTIAEIKKDSPVYQNMTHVLSAGLRAKELVQQILTFSRQEEKEPKPVQLKPLIEEVLKLIRASLPSSIKIEQDLKGNPVIMADTIEIHQVLMNLCTNAGHAMEEKGGTLMVELASIEIDKDDTLSEKIKPGPYVLLMVNDTGCGMSDHVKQRLFDPFFTTKQRGQGTGMGLSVVHGIISSFDGSILVYSRPGEGSTFKLFFPAVERRSLTEERSGDLFFKGNEHILFVDDDPTIVTMTQAFLESLEYKVSASISSLEALDIVLDQKNRIDLVITDVDMPELTGIHLAEKIIKIKPGIPIVLCSGYSSGLQKKYARDIGISGYLSKPVLMRDLSKTIRTVLDGLPPQNSRQKNGDRILISD